MAVFCGSAVPGLKSGTARRTFSTPRLVPVLTQSCANRAGLTRQEQSIRARECSRTWKLIARRRKCGLADSCIRLKIQNLLYGNILFVYAAIRNIFSIVLKLLIDVRFPFCTRCRCLNHLCTRRIRSEEHTSELQSRQYLVCRLLLEK